MRVQYIKIGPGAFKPRTDIKKFFMYNDQKTASDRLGRNPHARIINIIMIIAMATAFIGAMHADHTALMAGLIH